MRVFVTGATGFIGSTIVPDLINAGHQVLGLARSDAGAAALTAMGAQVQRGDLNDLESLRRGTAQADGVIHTAFIHDFTKFKENCEIDRRAIEAIGDVLAGSNRPFVVTSGIPHQQNRATTEDDPFPAHSPVPRVSETAALAYVPKGVRVSIMRLPQVHDRFKQGLVTAYIAIARAKGVAAYLGAGLNRYPALHVLDAAPLYRLALEKAPAGARYHAVAEEGVPLREIAEAVGQGLKIPVISKSPEEAAAHFGWFAFFAGVDATASSALTQQRLGWHPVQKTSLIDDLKAMNYE